MLAAYCAVKAGVTGLIRALAGELGPTVVTANAVSPGSTDTAMLDESARLYGLAESRRSLSNSRCADSSNRTRWPPSSRSSPAYASSAVTGAVVPVDGGFAL